MDNPQDSNDQSVSNGPAATNSDESAIAKEKKKLKTDIAELKALNVQILHTLNTKKFANLKRQNNLPSYFLPSAGVHIYNVDQDHVLEFYALSGFHCTVFNNTELVFEFIIQASNELSKIYAIGLHNDEILKVKHWVLPMSMDMKDILAQTPLKEIKTLKPFLRNCKQQIDCHINRVSQYNAFKAATRDVAKFHFDSNISQNRFILKFFDVTDATTQTTKDIILNLRYKSNQTRPYRLEVDCDVESVSGLTEEEVERYESFFKPFVVRNLTTAFEETVCSENTPISWKKTSKVQHYLEEMSDSSTSSSNVQTDKNKKRTRKTSRRRNKERKRRRKNNDTETPGDSANESEETDLENQIPTIASSRKSARQTPKPLSKKRKAPERGRKESRHEKLESVKKPTLKEPKEKKQTGTPEKVHAMMNNHDVHRKSLRQSTLPFKHPADTNASVSTNKKLSSSIRAKTNHTNIISSTPVSKLTTKESEFQSESMSLSPIVQVPSEK